MRYLFIIAVLLFDNNINQHTIRNRVKIEIRILIILLTEGGISVDIFRYFLRFLNLTIEIYSEIICSFTSKLEIFKYELLKGVKGSLLCDWI